MRPPWGAATRVAAERGGVISRGHGGSDGRDHIDWHTINDFVDDLVKVVSQIDEPPVLIGHSMGGFVVQKYLEHHQAAGVVLLCSVPPQGLVASQFHLMFQKPLSRC